MILTVLTWGSRYTSAWRRLYRALTWSSEGPSVNNTHPEMLHRCKGQLNKREEGNAVNTGRCLSLRQSSKPVSSYLCPRTARMWWLKGVERKEQTKPQISILQGIPRAPHTQWPGDSYREKKWGWSLCRPHRLGIQHRHGWYVAFTEPAAEQLPEAWPAAQGSDQVRGNGTQCQARRTPGVSCLWEHLGKQAGVPTRTWRKPGKSYFLVIMVI